jgi:UDP-glucose 4-epimerase
MNILITGGLGYIGRALLESLKYSEHNITILTPVLDTNVDNAKSIIGDILIETDLDKAFKNIDIVIHLAAISEPTVCKANPTLGILVNAIGTRNVLIAASNNNVKKVIVMSTFHVYDLMSGGDIVEDSKISPKSDYAISKAIAEYYCQNFYGNTKYTILRLSNVVGYSKSVNGNKLVVNDFINQSIISNKIVLKTTGTQKRNFVGLKDIIQAINIVINNPKDTDNQIFNVGGIDNLSIYDVAKKVVEVSKQIYNKDINITTSNIRADSSDTIILNYKFDKISKIGYNPTTNIVNEIKHIFLEQEDKL